LDLGLDKFNAACRSSVFTYRGEWEEFFTRVGRWTDTAHAYASIDTNYTESVWWVFKQIHEKGLLYEGYKSMPYCPRCETPLSNFELNEGYKDNVTDPSLYVKLKLADEDAFLLVWTTTPWSLPGNGAVAVKPEEDYVYVEVTKESHGAQTLVVAKKRLDALMSDGVEHKVIKEVPATELVGKRYEPVFTIDNKTDYPDHENLYKVWAAENVSIDDGTGLLHVAPSFGEEDLGISQKNHFPSLRSIDASGKVATGFGVDDLAGKFFKGADAGIIERLTETGNVYESKTFQHTYPFCYRCDSPLFYYSISTWFVKVSAIKDKLLSTAAEIQWSPANIKDGRFGKWLEGARDWAISRNRYWGAPMPIWRNVDDESDYIVIGSIEELKDLVPDAKLEDLHRPFIDDVVIVRDGKTYKRIEEVLDCWFESGSMPIAQQHYPFENKEKFDVSFPADYIGEGLDQTRLWFYVLHVISTIIFERPAYKNVLVNGMIMAADGQKLSKRLKNYPPIDDVFAQEGADVLRLYLLSNNQAVSADYMRFNRDGLKDLTRNVIATIDNSVRFFKMYAELDGWKARLATEYPIAENTLDRWMLARLNETIEETTRNADAYHLAHAINPIFSLIDDMSNWFIRRSRRRFWKSEDDTDKAQAYAVLHYTLVKITQLLAPWAPFASDRVYRELTGGESVHLTDWPTAEKVDDDVLGEMKVIRDVITTGLKQRADTKVKVRQPLSRVTVAGAPRFLSTEEAMAIIREELNVKEVVCSDGSSLVVTLDTELTDVLKSEGIARDLIRHIQNLRKKSGLEVDDRIVLVITGDAPVIPATVKKFGDLIRQETLATQFGTDHFDNQIHIKLDDVAVSLSLTKSKSA